MVLVTLVADHVDIPVVAAGGIVDSRGYRAALVLGAQGVQLGTRFLCSFECPVDDLWKQAIVKSTDGDTDLIPAGPHLRTRVIVRSSPRAAGEVPGPVPVRMIEPEADTRGNAAHVGVGAGQASALIREIMSVKEIIVEMTRII